MARSHVRGSEASTLFAWSAGPEVPLDSENVVHTDDVSVSSGDIALPVAKNDLLASSQTPSSTAYAFTSTTLPLSQPHQQSILGVQPVLRLVPDDGVVTLDYVVGDLFAAMGRQTVH